MKGGKMDRLDKEIDLIENDESLSEKEKILAIREVELAFFGALEEQRQMEHEAIDRKYGY